MSIVTKYSLVDCTSIWWTNYGTVIRQREHSRSTDCCCCLFSPQSATINRTISLINTCRSDYPFRMSHSGPGLNFPRQPTMSDAGNICICLQQKSAHKTCELPSPWGPTEVPHSLVRFWGLRLISPEEQPLQVWHPLHTRFLCSAGTWALWVKLLLLQLWCHISIDMPWAVFPSHCTPNLVSTGCSR